MLGLILIYHVGKYFYVLAERFDKGRWTFAILGLMSYYGGLFLSAILMTFGYIFIYDTDVMDKTSELVLSVLSVPFGILTCYLFYKYLERRWESINPVVNEIELIGQQVEES